MLLPLVTVIIPSYNHELYIEKAILSVVNQSYSNIELIVIDDGSSDNSHKLISRLSEEYKFRYIHRSNKGLIKTLNQALELSNGDYITMLGSDDYFEETKIEKQIFFFNNHKEYVLCYGNVNFINKEGHLIKKGKTKKFKDGYVFDKLIYQCFIPLPTVMLKKDVLIEFNGFDERFFLEDYPLWLKISKKYQIGFINDVLTNYRLHDTNVSSNLVKMIKEIEKILFDWKDDKKYKSAINKWYYRWFCDLSKTDNLIETKEFMIKSFAGSFYKLRFIRSVIRYYLKYRKTNE